jgi:hypothetical protein
MHAISNNYLNRSWRDLYVDSFGVTLAIFEKLAIFLIGIVGGGVQLGPLSTVVTNRPIVQAPADYDGEIGGMMKLKYSEKTCPSVTLSTTNPGSQRLTSWAMARQKICQVQFDLIVDGGQHLICRTMCIINHDNKLKYLFSSYGDKTYRIIASLFCVYFTYCM